MSSRWSSNLPLASAQIVTMWGAGIMLSEIANYLG
jgi:hypothetical protein